MNSQDTFRTLRERLISTQIESRGIGDRRVLNAMRCVPRHEFLPAPYCYQAYEDCTVPLPENQSASQPFVIALMLEALHLKGHERVLEVGTGSGYQTALLCLLAGEVYTLERHPHLARRAARTLDHLNYNNVEVLVGDGSQGLPDMAVFDAIIVTAAAPALPEPLRLQLNPVGGRMILPIGDIQQQYLEVVTRFGNRWEMERTRRVRFAPLIGRYGYNERTRQQVDGGGEDRQAFV